jgi:hypothetical protein
VSISVNKCRLCGCVCRLDQTPTHVIASCARAKDNIFCGQNFVMAPRKYKNTVLVLWNIENERGIRVPSTLRLSNNPAKTMEMRIK